MEDRAASAGTGRDVAPPSVDSSVDSLTKVIAIDGPAGSGKSTVARRVAETIGWRFVDSGAGYRAATLAALRAGIDLADTDAVIDQVARSEIVFGTTSEEPCVRLNGEDVSSEIRGPDVTGSVSAVSAIPAVRAQLIGRQRQAMGTQGAVVEGRDIATVVAPHARLKVYLDARPEVRARRRAADHAGASSGEPDSVASKERADRAIAARDERDNRTTPLRVSEGALHLDTSDLDLQQVVQAIVDLARDAGLLTAAPPETQDRPPDSRPARSSVRGIDSRQARSWVRATGGRKAWLVAGSRPFGKLLFRSLFRVTVRGAEHVPAQGAVLLAGNHTGFLDGPLVYALSPRPATFLAKSELFIGPLARILGWLGQIPVHRGRADRAALRAGLAVLREGGALGVFPEGTRGTGQLDTVSDGLAYLALHSGAQIVPLAVLGTHEAMPRGASLPRWRAPVTLVFGPPFQVQGVGDPRARRTVRAAGEQIRLALVAHLRAAAVEHVAPRR